MTIFEKIKKTIIIALGFAISTYLIMSGTAMLDAETANKIKKELDKKK